MGTTVGQAGWVQQQGPSLGTPGCGTRGEGMPGCIFVTGLAKSSKEIILHTTTKAGPHLQQA